MKTIHTECYRALVGKLRAARKSAGLTQAEAGRAVGMGRNWVSLVETAQLRLDVLHFVLLCMAYDLSAPDVIRAFESDLRKQVPLKR